MAIARRRGSKLRQAVRMLQGSRAGVCVDLEAGPLSVTPRHPTARRIQETCGGRRGRRRGLTSLQFCCAGRALTRGRELSGERPRTLI